MGAADDVIVKAQSRLGEVQPDNKQCARFVSDVFKEAGQGQVFPWSTWVPTIVASFKARNRVFDKGGQATPELKWAMPADLIVFGNDEHIGIYVGNGLVINTNGAGGTPKVQLQLVSIIRADSGGGFSKILVTGMSPWVSQPVDPITVITKGPGDLVNGAEQLPAFAASVFGTMFAWVPGFAVAALVIVLAAVLALEGGRMMLESTTGD